MWSVYSVFNVNVTEYVVNHVAVCCLQGAGVEIYPGSVCTLVGNGIHHCKDGILIKVRTDKMKYYLQCL